MDYYGPVYIRINRNDLPVITKEEEDFVIGKIYKIANGTDVTIFACGLMIYQTIQAREILARRGISVRVVNVSTVKLLDVKQVRKYAKNMKGVVTTEEHSIIGGLGDAISDALGEKMIRIKRVGINDTFGQLVSNYEKLIKHYGLHPEVIVKKVEELL